MSCSTSEKVCTLGWAYMLKFVHSTYKGGPAAWDFDLSCSRENSLAWLSRNLHKSQLSLGYSNKCLVPSHFRAGSQNHWEPAKMQFVNMD